MHRAFSFHSPEPFQGVKIVVIPELLFGPFPARPPSQPEETLIDPELLSLTRQFLEDIKSQGATTIDVSLSEGLSDIEPMVVGDSLNFTSIICYLMHTHDDFMDFVVESGGYVPYRTFLELIETGIYPEYLKPLFGGPLANLTCTPEDVQARIDRVLEVRRVLDRVIERWVKPTVANYDRDDQPIHLPQIHARRGRNSAPKR